MIMSQGTWWVRGTAVTIVAALLVAVTPRLQAQQTQDVVYLKDGSVIRGTIVEQQPGVSLLIRTRDGSTFRYAMDQIERITKEAHVGGASVAGRKSPGVAFLFSFLIVGGGQAYNGQWTKAGIMFGGAVVGGGLFAAYVGDCWNGEESCPQAYGGLGLLLGMAIWSMIDAPVSASAINRRLESGGYGLEVGPRIVPDAGGRPALDRWAARAAGMARGGPRAGVSLARVSF
jgi:hypothetical protein